MFRAFLNALAWGGVRIISERTPPLNPPKRPKEVGVARRHNSKPHGKRYKLTLVGGGEVVEMMILLVF